jgi:hypothetical protein
MYPEFDESRTKEKKNKEKKNQETRKKRRNYSLELKLQRKEECSEWTRKVSRDLTSLGLRFL